MPLRPSLGPLYSRIHSGLFQAASASERHELGNSYLVQPVSILLSHLAWGVMKSMGMTFPSLPTEILAAGAYVWHQRAEIAIICSDLILIRS
jgi:hypothetical protein